MLTTVFLGGALGLASVLSVAGATESTAADDVSLTWGRYELILESAGAEPKHQLHAQPGPGIPLLYRFDQTLTLEMDDPRGGKASRTSSYPSLWVGFTPSHVVEDGKARRAVEIDSVVYPPTPDMTAALRRDMDGQIAALEGARIAWGVEPSGRATGADATLSGNITNPPLAMTLIDELVFDWSLPFPDEPVGEGASWVCEGELPVRMVGPGARAKTRVELSLVEIAEGQAKIELSFTRDSERRGPTTDAPAQGAYHSKGTATVLVDLESGYVVYGATDRTVDSEIPLPNGQEWELHLDVKSLVAIKAEDATGPDANDPPNGDGE